MPLGTFRAPSCNPAWSAATIRNALTATAKDVGAAGRDTSYGYGIVQAQKALISLAPSGTVNCPRTW